MPAVVPFIPLIASGIGLAGSYMSGKKQEAQNQQVQQQMQNTQSQQMNLFNQAQQLILGMQNIAGQYGQANQGFLGDRQALDGVMRNYGDLYGQMASLYNQGNPAGEGMDMLRGLAGKDGTGNITQEMMKLYSQNPTSGTLSEMVKLYGQDPTAQGRGALSGLLSRADASDEGAAAALRGNAAAVVNATNPAVYREQARLAGNDAMGQLASQLASRGIASSGSSSRLGAATLSRLYSDAAARGQQDQLNAYGLSNNALSSAGNIALQRAGMQASLAGQLANLDMQGQNQRAGLLGTILNAQMQGDSQKAGLLGQIANIGMQGQQMQASLAGQLANLGMQGGQYQAGLLGQAGNMLGQQQNNILQGSGLLGNYLQGLQGQFGMQQGIAGLYTGQAGALGGIYNQQAGQINPNPWGGFGASLGAVGNAAGNLIGQKYGQVGTTGVPSSYGASGGNSGGSWGGVHYNGGGGSQPLTLGPANSGYWGGNQKYSAWA